MSIKSVLPSLIYQCVSILINNKHRLSLVVLLLFISIAHANPPTYSYLPGLKDYQGGGKIVQELEQDFKLNRFKKFSGSTHAYYSRYNDKIRLIWAKQNDQFILVEILYEHKYHKSEWIPKLKNNDHHPLDQATPFNRPSEQASASSNAPEAEAEDEVYYIQNRVIELDHVQEAVLNNQFQLSILVGSAGAGKTTLALIDLQKKQSLVEKCFILLSRLN